MPTLFIDRIARISGTEFVVIYFELRQVEILNSTQLKRENPRLALLSLRSELALDFLFLKD